MSSTDPAPGTTEHGGTPASVGPATTASPTTNQVVAAQRARYGGVKWGSAFFGWLSATGLAVLLIGALVAAGVSVGLTEAEPAAVETAEEATAIGTAGTVAVLVVVFLAYLAGGYVAGRMARFHGTRQGIAVWLVGLLAVLVLGVAALVGGSRYNLLQRLDLPRIPVDEGTVSTAAVVALVAVVVTSLVGAMLGGRLGTRFHRRVDRTDVDG